MEGQVAYRGLPGIVVRRRERPRRHLGQGFGFADINAKLPMTPTTKFRMASHSKLFTAIALMQCVSRGSCASTTRSQSTSPVQGETAGDDDGPITIEQLLSHSSACARGGDHWTSYESRLDDECAGSTPIGRRVRAVSTVEVFQPGVLRRRMIVEQVSGERWPLRRPQHLQAPGLCSPRAWTRRGGACRTVRAPHPDGSREVLPFVDARAWRQPPAVTSNWRKWPVSLRPVPQGRRGGAQV